MTSQAKEPIHGRAPTCPACGAPLPIELGDARVRCRHCGAVTPLDEGLRRAMLAYVGDVVAVAKKELQARFVAAFYEQNAKAAKPVIFGVIGFATFLTFAFVAGLITGEVNMGLPLLYFGILFGGWVLSLAAFTRGWGVMYDIPDIETLAATGIVRCDGCGAMHSFRAGEAVSDCKHCRSRLLVPFALAASLLGEARASKDRADREQAQSYDRAANAGDRLVGVSVFLVFFGILAAMVTVIAIGRPEGPEVTRTEMWLSFLGTFVLSIVFMVRSTKRGMQKRQEMDAQVDALARRVGDTARRG
ncbi:zinc ribbon domain-containing protein [Polyangium jinanense]|uniref:Zinc ribbon domain-containing protein n=1 Tax=Polyangium jinanense TaxID=2829994 RepID=A0A9X3XF59_9BACT|nr:zinc ribbon domain-containing protein [Polyangium jinanense]MDC3958385.1 zinc ribbon domain-containing protein [Polyangium jinanense]MDC3988285.1 zinc ribbon domain-containing protein [Polyangium jinanense]